MSEVMQQQQFKDQVAYPQVSVIRVDKKTSLLVYRQDAGESILQNANEPQHNPTFASTLKSIFTPSGNVFSAEAARAKNESSRRRSLSAPGYKDLDSKNGRSRAESSTSSLDSGSTGESSPKVSFAPLPEAERPRGRSASISCGVSARAALLRGEIPAPTQRDSESSSASSNAGTPSSVDENAFEDSDEEEDCGRAICRNSTITKENAAQHPESRSQDEAPGKVEEEKSGKWSDKIKRSLKRRSSSTSSTSTRASGSSQKSSGGQGNVVYEVVSNEEAERYVSEKGARRGTADLKVVPEREEDQWIEETEYAGGAGGR